MRHQSRITEDEAMERARERHSKANVSHLELVICRQAMRIKQLEQQVADLSETRLARQVAYVIDRLGLRYAHNPHYIHTPVTPGVRRDLAEVLNVDSYAAADGRNDELFAQGRQLAEARERERGFVAALQSIEQFAALAMEDIGGTAGEKLADVADKAAAALAAAQKGESDDRH